MILLSKIRSFFSHPIESMHRVWNYCIYKPRFRQYHWSCGIDGAEKITCACVSLGEKVRLGPRCRIQGIMRYEGETFEPTIEFGNGVSIQQDFYLTCASRIVIGENTAIAAFVTITDICHPFADVDIPIENQKIKTKEVYIGPECKIYNGAVITYGTRIGKHCVIGANSVVKGDIPDYSIVTGNPSRIIKRYNILTRQWQNTDADGNFIEIL